LTIAAVVTERRSWHDGSATICRVFRKYWRD